MRATHRPRVDTTPRHRPPADLASPRDRDGAQAPDPQPGNYYVSVVDGPKQVMLSGPYPGHARALDDVPRVAHMARQLDTSPFSHFYAYGTCRLTAGEATPGALQRHGLLSAPRGDAQPEVLQTPEEFLAKRAG
jgi:hypothetical protein